MIKVLHVFNSNLVSGPEKSVIPGLFEMNKLYPSVQCEVLFLEEKRIGENQKKATEFAQQNGLVAHSIEVSGRYDRKAIKQLRSFLIQNEFQIVHAQDVKATVYSAIAMKNLPLRLISTFHGFVRKKWKDKVYEWIYFNCVKKAQDLVTISQDNYKILNARFSSPHVHLIENKIPKSPIFSKEKIQTLLDERLKSNVQPKKPWAIMLARFAEEKDHKMLFAALALLPASLPFTVWLFGFGAMEVELKKLSKELAIENRVIFGGYLDDASSYLSPDFFDFLILSSWTEGLPIALLEGSWMGLPCIGTDIPGIRKVLPDDQLGFFSPARDAQAFAKSIVKAVSLNPDQLKELKEKILQHMELNFSHKVWCKRMHQLYINSSKVA
ncbi:MAG: glycosyltransferase family 4 protein [Bacteriovoracaceae bacterium]